MANFYTFVNEIEDGYDSVEWLASQSWCTGKVGMYGVSYVGATQWLAAKAKPPSLAAIAPGVTASNYQEGWAWQGGAFELGFNLSWTIGALTAANWANLSKRLFLPGDNIKGVIEAKDDLTTGFDHLPMQDMPDLKGELAPYYYDWLAHPEYDNYWKKISIEESHSDITVPSFNFGRLVRCFPGGHHSQLHKDARDGRYRRRKTWSEAGHRPLGSRWLTSQRIGRIQLRHTCFGSRARTFRSDSRLLRLLA